MHERAFFEVFCESKGSGARGLLGHEPALSSEVWVRWRTPLNSATAHLYSRWKDAAPVRGGDHLKDQVVDLAHAVLALWREFEQQVAGSEVAEVMAEARHRAIAESDKVADGLKRPRLEWMGADDPAAAWGPLKWWPDPELAEPRE